MFFKRLPEVKKCCCFLPLKWGTVFIALFYMVLSAANNKFHISGVKGYTCYAGAYDENCPYKNQMKYFTYITIFVAFMYFVPSVLLIVGVLMNTPKIVTVFLFCITLSVLIAVCVDFSVFVLGLAQPACGIPNEKRATCLIGDLVFLGASIYFVIVVKSYRSTLILERSLRIRSGSHVHGSMQKTDQKIHVPRTLSIQSVSRKNTSLVNKLSARRSTDVRSSSSEDDRLRYERSKKSNISSSQSGSEVSSKRSSKKQSSFALSSSDEKPKTSKK